MKSYQCVYILHHMIHERDLQSRENRLAAIAAGLNSYDGNPCRNCGTLRKYVNGSRCIECGKKRTLERSVEVSRRYETSAKGKHTRSKITRTESYKQMQKRWRQSEQGLAYKREEAMRRFIVIKAQTPELSVMEKAEMMMYYQTAVHLSRTTGQAHHVDHIIPISKGGLHHPDNMQVLTAEENLAKRAMLPQDWYAVKNA